MAIAPVWINCSRGGGEARKTDFTISEARGKEGRDDDFSAQRRARFHIVLGAKGERSHVDININFCANSNSSATDCIWGGTGAARKLLAEHSGESLLERNICNYFWIVSSSSSNNYQIKKVSYNYLVIRAIFDEPMYVHTDRGTGDSNLDQPIPLGKHKDGDLQNAVQIRCGHSVYRSNVDFSTTSRIHLCSKTLFDKTLSASQHTNFSGCMFDLSSPNRDDSLKASKINLVYDSLSEEYCDGHSPNILCLLLKDGSSIVDYNKCRVIFATDANGTSWLWSPRYFPRRASGSRTCNVSSPR